MYFLKISGEHPDDDHLLKSPHEVGAGDAATNLFLYQVQLTTNSLQPLMLIVYRASIHCNGHKTIRISNLIMIDSNPFLCYMWFLLHRPPLNIRKVSIAFLLGIPSRIFFNFYMMVFDFASVPMFAMNYEVRIKLLGACSDQIKTAGPLMM